MTVDCADGRCMVVLIEQRADAHRGETEMTGSHTARHAAEEGRKARLAGAEKFDNPYSFITETLQAYAWEEGYKRG